MGRIYGDITKTIGNTPLVRLKRITRGSMADRVMRSACVPVLMVRVPGCIPGT